MRSLCRVSGVDSWGGSVAAGHCRSSHAVAMYSDSWTDLMGINGLSIYLCAGCKVDAQLSDMQKGTVCKCDIKFGTAVVAGDGFVTAADLKAKLGGSADVDALIFAADKNKDGRIDHKEFDQLLRNS